jgi:hypothetical protein
MRLDELCAVERPQVREQLLLVARRQQRRHEDDLGNIRLQGGNGRISRVDVHQIGVDLLAHDALQDCRLPVVRLDC